MHTRYTYTIIILNVHAYITFISDYVYIYLQTSQGYIYLEQLRP